MKRMHLIVTLPLIYENGRERPWNTDPLNDCTCLSFKYKKTQGIASLSRLSLSSLVPTVRLFINSIQNVRQVYKARFILLECFFLLFITHNFAQSSRARRSFGFCSRAHRSCESYQWRNGYNCLDNCCRWPVCQSNINPFSSSYVAYSDTWSFELINVAFNNAFAIANNVNPSLGSLTITLPIVPVGYVVVAMSGLCS